MPFLVLLADLYLLKYLLLFQTLSTHACSFELNPKDMENILFPSFIQATDLGVDDIKEPSPYEVLAATCVDEVVAVEGDVAINDSRWQPW